MPADAPKPPAKEPGKWPIRWGSMRFTGWMRLLARGRWDFDRSRWPAVARITATSLLNSLLAGVAGLIYGRRVARTAITQPPIFILGYWRSGTTFLLDLMCLDERHTYATNLQCFAPDHFLLTEPWIRRLQGSKAEGHRPMDQVKVGLDTPAEDEFALMMMGLPSPYLGAAFPNRPRLCPEYMDLEAVSPQGRAAWKTGLKRFLQRVTYRRPGRLVLKSPTHTARIKILQELFPDALFVHIVRNPYVVFTSNQKMVRLMCEVFSLQPPPFPRTEENIFEVYEQVMSRLEQDRALVPPERFHELHYEDLVRDPVNQVRAIYEHFRLGGFEQYQPKLERYLADLKSYTPNQYDMPPGLRAEITRRWGHFIEKYGYATGEPPAETRLGSTQPSQV